MQQLFTGGEVLSVSHVRRALAALPDTELVNGYGPTECTTFTTTYRIPRDIPDAPIPIGATVTVHYDNREIDGELLGMALGRDAAYVRAKMKPMTPDARWTTLCSPDTANIPNSFAPEW